MQSHRVGPRAGMMPACLECRDRNYPPIRPIQMLYQGTFYFHFENLRWANRRNNTFLCYEVSKMECSLPVLGRGIFQKQAQLHAEVCFLYWFHREILKVLSPREEYKIVWYVSWSPCPACADRIARFLATHCNVSLFIFSARLYYFWDEFFQQNLRRMSQEGAHMAAMSFQEFKKCWEKFVDSGSQPFRPWKKLYINFSFQASKLQEILRSTSLLSENEFCFQFNNKHRIKKPHLTRRTYLCYQLQRLEGGEPLRCCLQNKRDKHAEILLIDALHSMDLDQVRVTCYMTWSPCPDCAQELAAFRRDHPALDLRIYASRLYFHWKRKFQEGLCSLWRAGVHMDVMGLPQFTECWTNFVSQQKPFEAWDRLVENSSRIARRLRRIQEVFWNLGVSFRLGFCKQISQYHVGNLPNSADPRWNPFVSTLALVQGVSQKTQNQSGCQGRLTTSGPIAKMKQKMS